MATSPAHSHQYQSLKIGLDEVNTPSYLDKPEIAININSHQMDLQENSQWAEELDKNIKRVIIANLTTMLPGAVVQGAPWEEHFTPNYHLQVTVTELIIDAAGNSSLRAEYLIYSDDHIIKKRDINYHLHTSPATVEALVKTINENLTHLSMDIAKSFRTL